MSNTYELLDSGFGRKLEKFGSFILERPSAQSVWKPQLSPEEWRKADATFTRDPENRWSFKRKLPDNWQIEIEGIIFQISPTDFGHVGIFPEQKDSWKWIQSKLKTEKSSEIRVLNLFAYSGGSTFASALPGAQVCHLDASQGMVEWARENARINSLEKALIRWIVDDARKFIQREIRRERRYEGIILDPPTFGRGAKGEIFKIEEEIVGLLADCKKLLSDHPLFILFSCHTPGFTPIVMHHLLSQIGLNSGKVDCGEMLLQGNQEVLPIPSGAFARWQR